MDQPDTFPQPHAHQFGSLSGKHAIVTGASSGLGRSIALELADAGANVIVHYAKSATAAKEVADEVQRRGVRSWVIQCDFAELKYLTAFVDQAEHLVGGIDIWVQNAGADLLTGSAAKWDYERKLQRLLDVDIRAGMLLTKEAGRRMVARGRGNILTIGWDQSDRGMEGDSGELFSAAKNAIMGYSRSLALSLAPNVRVNCIAPGWIKTAWGEAASETWQQRVLRETPLKRWGTPHDIAHLARFLVSDQASFITGQVINCNGGAVR